MTSADRQLRIVYIHIGNVDLCQNETVAKVFYNNVEIGSYIANGTLQYIYIQSYVQIGTLQPDKVEIVFPNECVVPPDFQDGAYIMVQARIKYDTLYAKAFFTINNEQPAQEGTQSQNSNDAQHSQLIVKPNIRQYEKTCIKIKILPIMFMMASSSKISLKENSGQDSENYPIFEDVPQNCRIRVNENWRNSICSLS